MKLLKIIFLILSIIIIIIESKKNNNNKNEELRNCNKLNEIGEFKKVTKYENIPILIGEQLTEQENELHLGYMKRVLEISKSSGVKFVSIIVSPDGRILCSGQYSNESPILHSELVAITNCSFTYGLKTFNNHSIYSTSEPDSLSSSAILYAKFKTVVWGTSIIDLYCNACYSNLPIESSFIFSKSYGIGIDKDDIKLIGGILKDEIDQNFGSYCNNNSISSIHKINPLCKCKLIDSSSSSSSTTTTSTLLNDQDDDDDDDDDHVIENKDNIKHIQNVDETTTTTTKQKDKNSKIESSSGESNKKEHNNKDGSTHHYHHQHHSSKSKNGHASSSSTSTTIKNKHGHTTHSSSSSSASSSTSSSSSSSSTSSPNPHKHHSHSSSSSSDEKHKKHKKDKKDKKDKKSKKEKNNQHSYHSSSSSSSPQNDLKIEKNK